MHPNPVEPFNFAKPTQKCSQQPLVLREVRAVAAGVLSHHDELLYPAVRQHPGFVEHVVQLTAAIPTPQVRNDAEGAAVVAAFGDFDKGVVLRGGDDPAGLLLRGIDGAVVRHFLLVQQRLNGGDDLRVAAGA